MSFASLAARLIGDSSRFSSRRTCRFLCFLLLSSLTTYPPNTKTPTSDPTPLWEDLWAARQAL